MKDYKNGDFKFDHAEVTKGELLFLIPLFIFIAVVFAICVVFSF